MKNLKKIIAAITVSTLALSVMGCKMIEKTPESIQKTVLATVGNEKITKGDLDKELKQYTDTLVQQYGENYASNDQVSAQLKQVKQQYLTSMVNEKVILQQAQAQNMKPSDDEVNKEVDDMINQYKAQYSEEGQFEQLLEANGFTEESFRAYQKDQSVIRYVYNQTIKDVTVSDDEIQSYYDENKESQFTKGAGAVVSHILVADEETANKLKAQLDGGADFAALAKQNSTDTGSKDNGGSLGYITYDSTQYVTEFMNGFKNLKEGEVSKPVKSQYGYHLIKVTGVQANGGAVPLDSVKDQIKSQLLQQKQNEAFNSKIEEWKKSMNVKVNQDKL